MGAEAGAVDIKTPSTMQYRKKYIGHATVRLRQKTQDGFFARVP